MEFAGYELQSMGMGVAICCSSFLVAMGSLLAVTCCLIKCDPVYAVKGLRDPEAGRYGA